MITADHAMNQAAATADYYARKGAETYRQLFGVELAHYPDAAATFIAGFMKAASVDFHAWAIQQPKE